jgi:hypothetical protein
MAIAEIPIAKETIDPNAVAEAPAFENAGFLTVQDDTNAPPLNRGDRQSLLHLIFHFTYTKEGRKFLLTQRLQSGLSEAQIGQALRDEIGRFGFVDDTGGNVVDAIVQAHVAADKYAHGTPDGSVAAFDDEQQKRYIDAINIVLGALHDDALGKDFKLNW